MQIVIIILAIFTSTLAFSYDPESTDIQAQIKNEFGACYKDFQPNLASCIPSTCTYPDLSDSKAWKAHVIRGMVNDKCYVIYYSYVGSTVLGEPNHCFYNKSQLSSMTDFYKTFFTTNSSISLIDAGEKIDRTNYSACKKNIAQQEPNNSQQ
jgi:hypothetical protein